MIKSMTKNFDDPMIQIFCFDHSFENGGAQSQFCALKISKSQKQKMFLLLFNDSEWTSLCYFVS